MIAAASAIPAAVYAPAPVVVAHAALPAAVQYHHSVQSIVPVGTKVTQTVSHAPALVKTYAAPLVHAPLAHAPLVHHAAPLAHAPLVHAPLAHAPLVHAPLAHAPLAHAPLAHGPLAYGKGFY